jgi:hypothetical protein
LRRLVLRVLAFLTEAIVVRVVLGLPDGAVGVTVRLSRALLRLDTAPRRVGIRKVA